MLGGGATTQTPILFSDLIGKDLTKEYAPELAYNRVIVGRTTAGVYSTGSANLGETPYLEKYITLPESNTTDLDTYASTYLANMREGWHRYSLAVLGISLRLYQLVDLTSIQFDLDIDDAQHVYRISDISYGIGETGSSSSMSLISKYYDVMDELTLISIGGMTEEQLNQSHIKTIVESAKCRAGTCTSTGSGTVTIEYDSGETETLTDRS